MYEISILSKIFRVQPSAPISPQEYNSYVSSFHGIAVCPIHQREFEALQYSESVIFIFFIMWVMLGSRNCLQI